MRVYFEGSLPKKKLTERDLKVLGALSEESATTAKDLRRQVRASIKKRAKAARGSEREILPRCCACSFKDPHMGANPKRKEAQMTREDKDLLAIHKKVTIEALERVLPVEGKGTTGKLSDNLFCVLGINAWWQEKCSDLPMPKHVRENIRADITTLSTIDPGAWRAKAKV